MFYYYSIKSTTSAIGVARGVDYFKTSKLFFSLNQTSLMLIYKCSTSRVFINAFLAWYVRDGPNYISYSKKMACS